LHLPVKNNMTRTLKLKTLEKAQRRISGLRYINPTINFGNGLNVPEFAIQVDTLQAKLDSYNEMVNILNQQREEIDTLERSLRGTSERMLGIVASIYGRESNEYEMVGGVKRVRRRRSKAAEPEEESTED
jgi:CII-binding regulator of phage lambda lysogenization HflD